MSAVCVIPARGGSTRVPRKNIRMFHGKPIIAYSIEAAKESGLFDEIWVSTDDNEIASIAIACGAKWHPRSSELSKNDVGTQQVMAGVIAELWPNVLIRPRFCCCLYATAPMLDGETLKEAYEKFDESCHYIVPVGEWLRDPGQFYFGYTESFAEQMPLLSHWTRILPIDPRTAIDINTGEDWLKAEQMFLALKEKQ